jgi:opacity protein-like surface antigen
MSFGKYRIFALLFVAVSPAYSQLLSFGVKAGVPFSDAYKASSSITSSAYKDHFIVGPTVEVHLPFRLSIEADALYRRNGFAVQGDGFNISSAVNDWQVPVLGKYEFHFGPFVHPFIDAGFVYRHVSLSNSGQTVLAANPNSPGFALGGGVSLKLLSLRISPEIRYTHWNSSAVAISSIASTRNQADLLVGFTF